VLWAVRYFLIGNPFRTDFILLHLIASTIDGIPNIQSQDTLTEYDWNQVMIKTKCDRCGADLGTESKKTKQKFCGNCKKKFGLYR